MKHYLLSLLLFIFATANALSQDLDPVKWDFNAEKVADNVYQISFDASIDDGWYLYSQDIGDDGPIATTFSFEDNKSVKKIDAVEEIGDLKEGYDPYFEMDIKKYAKKVSFKTLVTIADKTMPLTGTVRFMTCEDARCLPPKDVPFKFSFSKLNK